MKFLWSETLSIWFPECLYLFTFSQGIRDPILLHPSHKQEFVYHHVTIIFFQVNNLSSHTINHTYFFKLPSHISFSILLGFYWFFSLSRDCLFWFFLILYYLSIQVFIVEFILFLCDYFHCFFTLKALPDPQIRKIFIRCFLLLTFKFIWNSICSTMWDKISKSFPISYPNNLCQLLKFIYHLYFIFLYEQYIL